MVIARTWRGWTRREDAAAYRSYLERTRITEYRRTPGNRGAWVLTRDVGERTEFVTLSFWEDRAAIRRYAPDDIDRAVLMPEDDRYLVEGDKNVIHRDIDQ